MNFFNSIAMSNSVYKSESRFDIITKNQKGKVITRKMV